MEVKNSFEQNYIEEIIAIIRSELSVAELGQKLEQYHDNDIAEAFGMLEEDER